MLSVESRSCSVLKAVCVEKSVCDCEKMSDVQMLKSPVNHRLTVAAEEELILLKEEKDRQEKLLDSVFNPDLHRADVHQLMIKEEEVLPEQQEWSSSLKQENPAEAAHVKEEQEEEWINQEREQLQEPKEDEIVKFTFFPVTVKSEDEDEEKPQPFQPHENQSEDDRDTEHLKTEADGEDCGGSEPDRDFNPHSCLQPVRPDETSEISGSDTDDSADWEGSDEPQEGSNPQQNKDRAVSDLKCKTGETSVSSSEHVPNSGQKKPQQKSKGDQTVEMSFSCSVCGNIYDSKVHLQRHMYRHSTEKPFSCPFCGKSFIWRKEMVMHVRVHTGEKPFSCSVCGKKFALGGNLNAHLVVHTGEKPFSCSVCGKSFSQKRYLREHALIHSGDKTFSCSVCDKRYPSKKKLEKHVLCHSAEKPFSCSVCQKYFIWKAEMLRHMRVHTRVKPFSCSVCGKNFTRSENLKRHAIVHTGEKPFSCSVCGGRFTQLVHVKQHKCVGESSVNPK